MAFYFRSHVVVDFLALSRLFYPCFDSINPVDFILMYDPVYLPANAAREVAFTTHMGDVLVSDRLNLSIK